MLSVKIFSVALFVTSPSGKRKNFSTLYFYWDVDDVLFMTMCHTNKSINHIIYIFTLSLVRIVEFHKSYSFIYFRTITKTFVLICIRVCLCGFQLIMLLRQVLPWGNFTRKFIIKSRFAFSFFIQLFFHASLLRFLLSSTSSYSKQKYFTFSHSGAFFFFVFNFCLLNSNLYAKNLCFIIRHSKAAFAWIKSRFLLMFAAQQMMTK